MAQSDNPIVTRYLVENPYDYSGITQRYLAKKAEQGNKEAKGVVYEHYDWTDFCCAIVRWANNGDKEAKDFVYESYAEADYLDAIVQWGNNGDKEAQQFIIDKYDELKDDYEDLLRNAITSWANEGNKEAERIILTQS